MMAVLNSAELREKVQGAGIKYLPSGQIFFQNFPYKVELSPKFKGLGSQRRRGCQIDINNPERARAALNDFNQKMEKIISNVEHLREIQNYVDRLPQVEYKRRTGGQNNLFYFRDASLVLTLVERYTDVINSVTGPINDNHEVTMDERNILMREKLYYDRYRYMIEFPFSEDFVKTARSILEHLAEAKDKSWRANRLETCVRHFDLHAAQGTTSPRSSSQKKTLNRPRPLGSPMTSMTRNSLINSPYKRCSYSAPDKIQLYLEDGNDYVYIKLMAAEYVLNNHEVVLFDELT